MKKFYSYCLATLSAVAMLFAVGCVDPEPEVVPEPPKPTVKVPTISVSTDEAQATVNSAVVLVAVTNADRVEYTFYELDARPDEKEIEWTSQPVDADGEFEVEFSDLATDITKNLKYTFEAKAYLKDSVTKPATCNFQTLQAAPVMLSDIKASASIITAVATFLPEHCDAYCWVIASKSDYEDYAKNQLFGDIEAGYGTFVKESAVLKSSPMSVNPDKVYIVAVQPVMLNEDGTFKEFVGDIIEKEITSGVYELGQSEASVVLTLDETSISHSGVKFTATRPDSTVGGVFYGAVAKADIGNKDIETYIEESKWFYAGGEWNENYRDFLDYYEKDNNDLKSTFVLESDTEYVVFVVAADVNGFVGKAVSKEVKTKAITFDDPASAVVSVANAKDEYGNRIAQVSIAFENNCTKVAWYKVDKGTSSLEEATKELVSTSGDMYGRVWTSEMEQPITMYDVQINTSYDLYTLPISANGAFGKVVHQEFDGEVSLIDWDESFTITAVQKGGLTKFAHNQYKATFTVTYSSPAVGYQGATNSDELFPSGKPSARVCAQKYYDLSAMGEVSNEEEITFTFTNYDETRDVLHYVVFVPVDDKDGKGEPVMLELTIPKGEPRPENPENPDGPGPRRR